MAASETNERYNRRENRKMEPKEKWTLREALAQLAPPEEQEEFRRLDTEWRGMPGIFILGAPPTPRDRARDRFYELDEELTRELLNRLQSGELKAEAIDPVRGPVPIHRRSWEVLKPNFKDSSAEADGRILREIRVWPTRPIRTSSRAEALCRKWLRELVERGHAPRSKRELLAKAQAKFGGLSERGFDRVWAEQAPTHWRKGGRRHNPPDTTLD